MRIALRTGGGRGVYELAGSQGTYRASDLFNREMFYELTPDLVVPGRAVPDVRQGKPRIKLNNQAMVGPIPRERLPLKSDYWPNSSYLDAFNQAMFP